VERNAGRAPLPSLASAFIALIVLIAPHLIRYLNLPVVGIRNTDAVTAIASVAKFSRCVGARKNVEV
jgi:hypothetical protein